MSLFLNLLRILAEEDFHDLDEEEIFELLESEDLREIEDLIEKKVLNSEKTVH